MNSAFRHRYFIRLRLLPATLLLLVLNSTGMAQPGTGVEKLRLFYRVPRPGNIVAIPPGIKAEPTETNPATADTLYLIVLESSCPPAISWQQARLGGRSYALHPELIAAGTLTLAAARDGKAPIRLKAGPGRQLWELSLTPMAGKSPLRKSAADCLQGRRGNKSFSLPLPPAVEILPPFNN